MAGHVPVVVLGHLAAEKHGLEQHHDVDGLSIQSYVTARADQKLKRQAQDLEMMTGLTAQVLMFSTQPLS